MIPVTCRHCGREALVKAVSRQRAEKCQVCGYKLTQNRPPGYQDGRSRCWSPERKAKMATAIHRLWDRAIELEMEGGNNE